MALDEKTIDAASRARKVKWTRHAKRQLRLRGVKRSEVFHVLQQGQILEQYPKAKPYPECLMMGFVRSNQPLYVELAYNPYLDYIYIITVHWMDPAKWIDPWTRRR